MPTTVLMCAVHGRDTTAIPTMKALMGMLSGKLWFSTQTQGAHAAQYSPALPY